MGLALSASCAVAPQLETKLALSHEFSTNRLPRSADKKLTSNGTFKLAGVTYLVGGQCGFQHVLDIVDDDTITGADGDGVVVIEHTGPAARHDLHRQRQTPRTAPKPGRTSPKS